MQIRDFIKSYNFTFSYIKERYRTDALQSLWEYIFDKWCFHFQNLTQNTGLEGMLKKRGCNDGTFSREEASYNTMIHDHEFILQMHQCPSVAEIIERGDEPHQCNFSYFNHCLVLNRPIIEAHGFQME
jgi:hypothetical protein